MNARSNPESPIRRFVVTVDASSGSVLQVLEENPSSGERMTSDAEILNRFTRLDLAGIPKLDQTGWSANKLGVYRKPSGEPDPDTLLKLGRVKLTGLVKSARSAIPGKSEATKTPTSSRSTKKK